MNSSIAPTRRPRGLVIFATTHGHTAKIAARIAQAMGESGLQVDLREVTRGGAARPSDYDLVAVGGSLHRERHQDQIADWVALNRRALDQRPSAFFSVSLSAAGDTDEAHADAQRCIDEFCAQTGWTPTRTEAVGGCLQYREYDAFTRQLIRLLMHRIGRPTDVSRDWDFTDWDAVDRLGREIAALSGASLLV